MKEDNSTYTEKPMMIETEKGDDGVFYPIFPEEEKAYYDSDSKIQRKDKKGSLADIIS